MSVSITGWVVARVATGSEFSFTANIMARGEVAYCPGRWLPPPRHLRRRGARGASARLQRRALYPGYVFGAYAPGFTELARATPAFLDVLNHKGLPWLVDGHVVDQVRAFECDLYHGDIAALPPPVALILPPGTAFTISLVGRLIAGTVLQGGARTSVVSLHYGPFWRRAKVATALLMPDETGICGNPIATGTDVLAAAI